MADGQTELRVPLSWTGENGVVYTKTFVFKRGEFAVNVDYNINNASQQPLEVAMFGQLKQTIDLPKHRDTGSNNFALHTFRGAAYSTSDAKYEKYKFDTIADNENLNTTTSNGWVAMLQQYFATAWVPRTQGNNTLYTSNLGNGVAAIGYKSAPVTIAAGAAGSRCHPVGRSGNPGQNGRYRAAPRSDCGLRLAVVHLSAAVCC